ncbi:MAG: hypothetical protein C5S48_02910 [Candidatus Methanogaster sp.]|nr:MAG: hypothetical protein C5S48_02910 [ANME-2 cluster archaeon]
MPESHKHPQERAITNGSGQQCPGVIAAGGPEAPERLAGAKTRARGAGRLTESHARRPKRCRSNGDATILPTPFLPPNLPTPAPQLSALKSGTPNRNPADAPKFIAGWRGWGVIPFMSPNTAPPPASTSATRPRSSPHPESLALQAGSDIPANKAPTSQAL